MWYVLYVVCTVNLWFVLCWSNNHNDQDWMHLPLHCYSVQNYKEEGYVLPTQVWKITPTFWLNAPVIIRGFRVKVKEVQTNVAIYSHAPLRIHVIECQRLVRIALSSLPPHHSGPATRDFQSSILEPTVKPLKLHKSNAEWWESLASFPGLPELKFSSDQKLELGKAWEQS